MVINSRVEIDNIKKTDLHMHTVFCDGKDTPEDMVLSAIEKGMECIGFSGHSFVADDPECGMNAEEEAAYIKEVKDLKARYSDKIRIFLGIEEDYLSGKADKAGENENGVYEYVIGSVHYIDTPQGPKAVDDTPEIFEDAVEKYYAGDYYAAAEDYFEKVGEIVEKTGADIIGHFDLIAKFNQKEKLFDEGHPRYVAAWKKAADRLLAEGKVFEINTGAVSRGWRDVAYPNPVMISYIKNKGGMFVYSGDSHTKENIGYGFSDKK